MDITLTPKQIEILILLYGFRFLTTTHIQTLLKHKEQRRIKSWLKDLFDKGFVGRIYSRTIGEGNKPAIYYLSTKSRFVLRGQKHVKAELLNRVYREKLRSRSFIDHCLFIADIYLNLVDSTESQKVKL